MRALRLETFALATIVTGCGARVAPQVDGAIPPGDSAVIDSGITPVDATDPPRDGAAPCGVGQRRLGDECVGEGAPRPIAPLSLGTTSGLRPRFRWVNPAGAVGARIELCRDRACATPIEAADVDGESFAPGAPLPARSVLFWRLRARSRSATDTVTSATWLLHTPAMDGSPETSTHPRLDLNGDGADDVAIGARFAGPNGLPAAGVVRISYGSARPSLATDVELPGVARFENFGTSVASAGDMNGDGYGEIIVGAPFAPRNGVVGAGRVAIYLGGPMGAQSAAPISIEAGESITSFGQSVSGGGDLNGDGYADVLIGSPQNRGAVSQQSGMVTIVFGGPALSRDAARIDLTGGRFWLGLGRAVSGGGDINGDGVSDFVVLAAPDSPVAQQQIHVVYGRADLTRVMPDFNFETTRTTDLTMGDLNHDGFSDFVAGAVETSSFESVVGRVYLGRSMSGPMREATVPGPVMDGPGVARARIVGDLNGDGFDDLALASPQGGMPSIGPVGAAHFFAGSARSVGARFFVLNGQEMNSGFGSALSGFCDHNGDGLGDVMITSASAIPATATDTGRAELYLGVMGATPRRAASATGRATVEQFGGSVASTTRPPTSALRGRSACRLRRPARWGC
ncbi:MAG: VCBS repeat-containing protein [Myxococcales bacterium]|nr:VCBS repeat-containing protein [Myxococcales bacterium]